MRKNEQYRILAEEHRGLPSPNLFIWCAVRHCSSWRAVSETNLVPL